MNYLVLFENFETTWLWNCFEHILLDGAYPKTAYSLSAQGLLTGTRASGIKKQATPSRPILG